MFQIQLLDAPETVEIPGGSITLTHKLITLQVDPRSEKEAVVFTQMKGFLLPDSDRFQDFGPHVTDSMDMEGLAAVGFMGGDFKVSDIPTAIVDRQNAIRAAKAAKEEKPAEEVKG